MARAAGHAVSHVRMDGGAAADDLLMQMHADLLGLPVMRPQLVEATAVGAALTGAVGLGIKTEHDLLAAFVEEKKFSPALAPEDRAEKMRAWQRAAIMA